MKWNSQLYDSRHGFVAEYGRDLLHYIPSNPEQRILDIGCGTGTLTVKLAGLGSYVLGIDSSETMIAQARAQYPEIDFQVGNALNLPFENQWDVVFSNAVFHWIEDHDTLLKNIRKALKSKGILICEFGAAGNISTIETAFAEALKSYGYIYTARFNFPTAKHFGELLTANGFVIDKIYEKERPTPLNDGRKGLSNWMEQFFASELKSMPDDVKASVFQQVEEAVKIDLWDGTQWIADYRRLRAVAHVQSATGALERNRTPE